MTKDNHLLGKFEFHGCGQGCKQGKLIPSIGRSSNVGKVPISLHSVTISEKMFDGMMVVLHMC